MTQLLDVGLGENNPLKEKGGKPVFILPPVGGSCQELRLAGSPYPYPPPLTGYLSSSSSSSSPA